MRTFARVFLTTFFLVGVGFAEALVLAFTVALADAVSVVDTCGLAWVVTVDSGEGLLDSACATGAAIVIKVAGSEIATKRASAFSRDPT
jgi:hypothetical protein